MKETKSAERQFHIFKSSIHKNRDSKKVLKDTTVVPLHLLVKLSNTKKQRPSVIHMMFLPV